MKIFCIDSTSYIPRIAIVENGNCVYERSGKGTSITWQSMKSGDISYLVDDFFSLIEDMETEKNLRIDMVDYICYSGCSGFRSTMNLGKIMAKSLGKLYRVETLCVDHITAHYFSQFTQYYNHDTQKQKLSFPILFFSASGSHNSLALLKNNSDLTVLHDETYFSEKEQKYWGLGSIYFHACKICNILSQDEGASQITKKLSNILGDFNDGLVQQFLNIHISESIFDMNFQEFLYYLQENIENLEREYSSYVVFRSFEEAIFQKIASKINAIAKIIPFRTLSIVGGISQNDDFFDHMKQIYEKKSIEVVRPHQDFRFDNASMLGTLAFYSKNFETTYPVSHIIT